MKKTLKKFNFKQIGKKVISAALALSFSLTLGFAGTTESSYGAQSASSAYKWTRIYSRSQLAEAFSQDGNTKLEDAADYKRVMIISSDGKYFVSKRYTSDDSSYRAQRVLSSYGIDVTQSEFITLSGLDTPFMKYCDWDDDNDCGTYYLRFCKEGTDELAEEFWCLQVNWYGITYHAAISGEFIFPCPTVSNTWGGRGKKSWASNRTRQNSISIKMSNYWKDYFDSSITENQMHSLMAAYNYTQVAYAGDYYYEYHPTTSVKIKYVKSHCTDTSYYDNTIFDRVIKNSTYKNGITGEEAYDNIFKPMCKAYASGDNDTETGMAMLFYNIPGAPDRYWNSSGNEFYPDEGDWSGWYIYVGEKTETPSVSEDYTLTEGVTIYDDMFKINQGVTVTVGKGATLIIKDHVVNNGGITVDGGTLIVEGCLDCFEGLTVTNDEILKGESPNDIWINSGGTLIVQESGSIIGRYGTSGLHVDYNSSVLIEGVVVVGGTLYIDHSSAVRVDSGALLSVGYLARSDVELSEYSPEMMASNHDAALSCLLKLNTYNREVIKQDTGLEPNVYVYNRSSLISNGIFVRNVFAGWGFYTSSDTFPNSSYVDVYEEYGIGRSFGVAMRYW